MTEGRNRITELERTVDELQSTVHGLTEELVEANQRIRDLEDAQELREAQEAQEVANTRESAEEDKSEGSQDSDTETGETRLGDDIIVA